MRKMSKRLQKFIAFAASGQTMVEALVALAAAVIIISSITVAVITSASNTSYSTNQNKATQLAREGLDALRKYRDTNTAGFAGTSGMYCYKDEIIISEAGKVDKPSECGNDTRIEDAYIRTLNFIPAGDGDNLCGEAVQVDSMVSWADGKCPANNQFCKNVRLVSCFSGSLATVQSGDVVIPGGGGQPENPPPPPPVKVTGYIQTEISCATPVVDRTPNQMCINKQWDGTAATTPMDTVAKGYWWKQSAGAFISNCTGLECTVNRYDDYYDQYGESWSMQNPRENGTPYPAMYIQTGTSSTVYNPGAFMVCDTTQYNNGWTVRVQCARMSTNGLGGQTNPNPETPPASTIQIIDPDENEQLRRSQVPTLRFSFSNSTAVGFVVVWVYPESQGEPQQEIACKAKSNKSRCDWQDINQFSTGNYIMRADAILQNGNSVSDQIRFRLIN